MSKRAIRFKMVDAAWVIRAGIRGSGDSYFMNEGIICLNDPGLGDLSQIKPDRQSFYDAYRVIKPDDTHAGIAGIGGKYYRFVHEMKVGDMVIYPSLRTRGIYVGEILGKYLFNDLNTQFPHQRKVKWITSFPKDALSKSAQYELGAARTFFKYKKHINEILTKVRHAK